MAVLPLKEPGEQAAQTDAPPALAKDPAAHNWQADMPLPRANVPALQFEQGTVGEPEKVPVPHATQVDWLESGTKPAEHV